MLRRTLNLGILAHVDAGKTTLTERLLHAAGVIHELGSVDKGTTQTDTLALEQQRGITIKTAVATFEIDGVTVNLIDTPGHPDFIAEVERVLAVLDGAVLVVSAVEGVQAQTPLLGRALERLRVPTLFFVNKTDRQGADPQRVVSAMQERLTPGVLPVWDEPALLPALAEHDDELLAEYVHGANVSAERLRVALAEQTRRCLVHPAFLGSALKGEGVDELMSGLAELLPAEPGDGDGPLSGTVFKIERGDDGQKVAYVRLFSGTLRARDRLGDEKVTAVAGFVGGNAVHRDAVAERYKPKVWGLRGARIGDPVGDAHPSARTRFPPPTLETVVRPAHEADKATLHMALNQLAEQDPLIDVRQEFALSLYGEVQKEVIAATLAADYGVAVTFGETTPLCVERPLRRAEAIERLNTDSNPFPATIALRIEPTAAGSGVSLGVGAAAETRPLDVYNTADRRGEPMDD